MSKTFQEIIISKKLTTSTKIKDYLVGKTCRVEANAGSHNYGAIGTSFKVLPTVLVNTQYLNVAIAGGNVIYFSEFSVQNTSTREDLVSIIKDNEEEVKKLLNDNADFEARIAFMDENKIQDFDENQYKAWRTLKIIGNEKLNDLQKSKLIADLIK